MGKLDLADKMHKENLKIVLLCNGVLAVLFAVLGRPILQLFFNADAAVMAYAGILFIDIFVELGRGMNHIGQYGLNATGDVHFTTFISIISCWACSVGLAYVFGIVCNLGLFGFWIAFAIDELFRGSLYFFRWLKKDWQKRFTRII
jgi:Na+-driven multidrug efflux pump